MGHSNSMVEHLAQAACKAGVAWADSGGLSSEQRQRRDGLSAEQIDEVMALPPDRLLDEVCVLLDVDPERSGNFWPTSHEGPRFHSPEQGDFVRGVLTGECACATR